MGKGDGCLESNSLREVLTYGSPKEGVNKSLIIKGANEYFTQDPPPHLLILIVFSYDYITAKTQRQGCRWVKRNKN